MHLLVATTNAGKLREIQLILQGVGIALGSLSDFPAIAPPEETGRTFAENARLKALYYQRETGLPTVAEDSGLVVDALGGEPGVHSARYLGENATYPERFAHIFRELAARGAPDSPARFVCALALGRNGAIIYEAEGRVEGRIAPEPRGSNGFGYDPIFFYPPYGKTLAEVDDQAKIAVAHRGVAFRQLREYLKSQRV